MNEMDKAARNWWAAKSTADLAKQVRWLEYRVIVEGRTDEQAALTAAARELEERE